MRAYELHEGLIQVPKKLRSKIEKFVFEWVDAAVKQGLPAIRR